MNKVELRKKATILRKQGKTYSEIQRKLKKPIPKSTLSYWCKSIKLSKKYRERIQKIFLNNAKKGRKVALIVNKIKREKYLRSIANRNKHLAKVFKNRGVAKIALAMLYLSEGSKYQRGSLMFGNTDPFIISLYMHLLRRCYNINESKFRCTLQCRADQNIKKLEKFWSHITKIPLSQFYKARIDPRTIGKPSKKLDYKGVCRIDYFSSELFIEIKQIPNIIYKGPVV
jgi:hypothetical protein